jgi:RNA polymerase sigma-70 factor (ECF subfamily)
VATRLLGRDAEVDDVVQDVFLIAFRGVGALRDPAATKAWLTKVAVRVSTRRLRWRRVRRLLGLDAHAEYEDLPDPSLSSEEQVVVSRIYALLDRLPVADRVAWTLRRVDHNPAEVVATLCHCSLATAKRRIARVDEAIRQELGHA